MLPAHGIGGAKDLPIPLEYALAGAGAALAVSFIVLAVAWRRPRYDAAVQGRPVPALQRVVDSPAYGWGLRVLGLAAAAYVGWAALFGPDLVTNPTFGVVYVLLWVGIVPASLLLGPVYRALNPVRTLHRLLAAATGSRPDQGIVALPAWVGVWPGALGLLAFTYLELVEPDQTYLSTIRLWFALYGAVVLVGAAVFGDRWIAAADPFEVFSTLVAHLSPWGRTADGTLVVRSPLANLDGTPAVPGLVGVVGVLLGSTGFDSFRESGPWVRFVQSSSLDRVLLNSAMLVAFCLVVVATFSAATAAVRTTDGGSRRALPDRFAHAVTPIVVGYFVAHYLTYVVETGTQTLIQLSDPMGTGANLLGTADWQTSYWLSLHPDLLAVVKVLAIVGGHVLGVVASHDRAIRLLPRRDQLTGQLPLLFVMVFYTVSGLYLLLSA